MSTELASAPCRPGNEMCPAMPSRTLGTQTMATHSGYIIMGSLKEVTFLADSQCMNMWGNMAMDMGISR